MKLSKRGLLRVTQAAALLWATGCTIAVMPSNGGVPPEGGDPTDDAGADGSMATADSGAGDATPDAGQTDASAGGGATWSMGYYYAPESKALPASAVDWAALTHLAVAFYHPAVDGSLDETLGLDATAGPALANELISAAHAHGVKVIASIGGAQSGPAFEAATAAGTLSTFVANLTGLLGKYGYDGIDIDWEPLATTDVSAAIAIAAQVRAADAGAILTIPVAYTNGNHPADLSGYASIAAAYDQVNVMTYHMAGPWSGWKSWHTSALYYGDSATPSSVDDSISQYLAAGVPAPKLGFGISFYGLCYTAPVTGPDQALGGASIIDTGMTYADIEANYAPVGVRQWDASAQVAYLSFGAPAGPNGCTYVTYDDPQSIGAKGAYLQSKKLGGVIVWNINRDDVGAQSPLLQAVGKAFLAR